MSGLIEEFFKSCEAISGLTYYVLGTDHKPIPVPMFQWAEFFQSNERQIALDEGDGWSLSSIFLGFDHSTRVDHGHEPLLFETMVFLKNGNNDQWRFTDYDECLAFHRAEVLRRS
jgi:hypothetical protein